MLRFFFLSTLVLLAILTPWWGFLALAVVFAAGEGRIGIALGLSLCADLLYGPSVSFHFLLVPFTLLTAVLLMGRYFLMLRLRDA